MPLPVDAHVPRELVAHLHRFAAGADEHPATLTGTLTALSADVQDAVSGYAGFALTVVHGGQPVVLSTVRAGQAHAVTTSLGLPLQLLSAELEAGGRAVFYSTTPGSLVDLAADLCHVLCPATAPHAPAPELDADLPPTRTSSGIAGLDELATVNRAVGVLLEQGHDPDTGLELLRRRALVAGVPVHVVAAELLQV
ncbi:hypothetical protein GCM10009616_15340 [Microlunatus lacustris]